MGAKNFRRGHLSHYGRRYRTNASDRVWNNANKPLQNKWCGVNGHPKEMSDVGPMIGWFRPMFFMTICNYNIDGLQFVQ